MKLQEVNDIIQAFPKLDISEMEMEDQIYVMMATTQFAEKLKAIVVKYADKLPKSNTFLFKM